MRLLVKHFQEIIQKQKIQTNSYAIENVQIAFGAFGAKTKYERAVLVTRVFGELTPYLPPKRRI